MTAATDLAAAIYGALDIPVPSAIEEMHAYCDVLSRRTGLVHDAVEGVVTDADARSAARIIAEGMDVFAVSYASRIGRIGGGPR